MVGRPTIWKCGLATWLIVILEAGLVPDAGAQVNCFVQTKVDRSSVYVQQPIKVTFTVLTATWYTAPLEFENLQIPGAFIISFDRTMSGMFPAGDKRYPGLQFYYIVFPYKSGDFTIPAISITATTPALGDSKPQKVKVESAAQHIVVKPVPSSFHGDDWLVASDASIAGNWNRSLKGLKVGDVIERTLVINARGTLPQFIPLPKKDSMDWAQTYMDGPVLTDTRDEYNANGRISQKETYLLEKEGDYEISEERISWWNPYSGKLYSRSLPTAKIHVAANPNLGILSTMRDSLGAAHGKNMQVAAAKKGPFLIFGIVWYWAILYILAGLLLLYNLTRWLLHLYRSIQGRYARYRQTEIFWFKRLLHSPLQFKDMLRHLYAWWDRLPYGDRSPSILATLRRRAAETPDEDPGEIGAGSMNVSLEKELSTDLEQAYGHDNTAVKTRKEFREMLRSYRRWLLKTWAGGNENEAGLPERQRAWPGIK